MPVSGETILVKREVEEGGNTQAAMVLNAVYTALKEAGHIHSKAPAYICRCLTCPEMSQVTKSDCIEPEYIV